MNPEKINQYGVELFNVLRNASTVPPLTERESDITIHDAYGMCLRILALRLEDVDLENVDTIVSNNDVEISRGIGSAALCSPLTCMAWLANTLIRMRRIISFLDT